MLLFIIIVLVAVLVSVTGLDRKPPMGWRSWNLYGDDVRMMHVMYSYYLSVSPTVHMT